jgi:hypothetical protein
MFGCLVDAKFNMRATVLSPVSSTKGEDGHYVNVQDPDTGEITKKWVVDVDAADGVETARTIDCMVRPVIANDSAVEVFTSGGEVNVLEFVEMNFPAGVVLTNSDRITEIRNREGYLLWAEEKSNGDPTTFKGTVFDIVGIQPVIDPFGNHIENKAYMRRAGVQSA